MSPMHGYGWRAARLMLLAVSVLVGHAQAADAQYGQRGRGGVMTDRVPSRGLQLQHGPRFRTDMSVPGRRVPGMHNPGYREPGMRPPGRRPPGRPWPPRFHGPPIYGIGVPVIVGPPVIYYDDDPPVEIRRAGRPRKPPPPRRATRRPPPAAASNVPPANERRYVPDEVVIEVGSATTTQQVNALARRNRLSRIETLPNALTGTTMFRWRIPDRRSVPSVIRALERQAAVRTAQPNYVFQLAQDTPAQPAAASAQQGNDDPSQYAAGKLHLPQAHGVARGDAVTVAVIDSEIDAAHPELHGAVAESFDATGAPSQPHDHGTGIAGAIAAHAKLVGVAPAAKILAVRAFASGASPASTTFAILKGLDWSVAHGARVINMSFTGPRDPAIGRSLAAADKRGVVLVAAAGNAGPSSPPLYPAAEPTVIAVTATDASDKGFGGANRGRHIAVAAPGVDVLLPSPGAGYQVSTGTSFSAAFVSGTVALLLQRKADLTPADARRLLVETALDLGPKGRDDEYGAGLIDAYGALMALQPKTGAANAVPASR